MAVNARHKGICHVLGGLLVLGSIPLAGACPTRREPSRPFVPDPLPLVHPDASHRGTMEPRLRALLREADPEASLRALVDLTDQLDLDAFAARLDRAGLGKSARREATIAALERVAERQQRALLVEIDGLIAEGLIDYARPVAIVNRIVIEGRAEGLSRLAARPEVGRLLAEWTSQRDASRGDTVARPAPRPPEQFTSWAVAAMGADRLWAEGLTGKGVRLATIDTGIFEDHEQLRGRRAPDGRGWFDPVEGSLSPRDRHGHGTSVIAMAVGGNPDGRILGIAPEATWSSALGNWLNFYSRVRMTLAADWVLRTARPDVLVNAWSHDEGPCSDFDLPFIRAWQAAGIFVVFPAGNAGPARASGESPAQLEGAFPFGGPVLSVAGLDRSGRPHPRSSRGPSRCGSTGFPTLAAPGSELPFAFPPNPRGYGSGDGTSLSAGLIGGAAALLLQAVPEASPVAIERALVVGARDVPPAGRDDATGAGAVDLPAALEHLRREVRR